MLYLSQEREVVKMKIYQVEVCWAYEGCYTVMVTIDRDHAYSVLEKELKELKGFKSESDNVRLTSWLSGKKLEEIDYNIYDEVIRPL